MMSAVPFGHLLMAAAWAAAGLAFGLVYFAALRWSVDLFVARSGWLGPALLTAGRAVAAAALLVTLAKLGFAVLLAGFLGFLAARGLCVRGARRAA